MATTAGRPHRERSLIFTTAGTLLALVVITAAVASTVYVVGFAGWLLGTGGGAGSVRESQPLAGPDDAAQAPAGLPTGISLDLGPATVGSRPPLLVVSSIDQPLNLLTVELYDSTSGQLAASVVGGVSPLALLRESTGQLIISDTEPGAMVSRLYMLDPAGGFEASPVVDIPSRADYSSYAPLMVLSNDERYVAIRQLLNRGEISGCQQGGTDLVCDDNRFAIVDLDTLTISGEIALAQGCGGHSAFPSPGGFAVVCASSGYVAEVSPRGEVLREVDFSALPGMQLNPIRRNPATLMFAAVVDGRFVVYRSDGLMIAEDGTSARVIPEGELIDEWFPLPGDLFVARLRIPTRAYVVFDLRTFEVLALHEVPGLSSIAPAGGDLIWTLSDGVVRLRNALTGEAVSDVRIEVGEDAYLLP